LSWRPKSHVLFLQFWTSTRLLQRMDSTRWNRTYSVIFNRSFMRRGTGSSNGSIWSMVIIVSGRYPARHGKQAKKKKGRERERKYVQRLTPFRWSTWSHEVAIMVKLLLSLLLLCARHKQKPCISHSSVCLYGTQCAFLIIWHQTKELTMEFGPFDHHHAHI
jgi:hypothetical protein